MKGFPKGHLTADPTARFSARGLHPCFSSEPDGFSLLCVTPLPQAVGSGHAEHGAGSVLEPGGGGSGLGRSPAAPWLTAAFLRVPQTLRHQKERRHRVLLQRLQRPPGGRGPVGTVPQNQTSEHHEAENGPGGENLGGGGAVRARRIARQMRRGQL